MVVNELAAQRFGIFAHIGPVRQRQGRVCRLIWTTPFWSQSDSGTNFAL